MATKAELEDALKPIAPPSAGKQTSSTKTKSTSGAKKPTQTALADIRAGLVNTFTLFGTAVSYADEFDGQVIVEKAEVMSDALLDVAKTNPNVMRALQGLIGAGAWSGVITVFGMQVAMPIVVHHGLLPEPLNTYLATAGDIEVKGKPNLIIVEDGDIEQG